MCFFNLRLFFWIVFIIKRPLPSTNLHFSFYNIKKYYFIFRQSSYVIIHFILLVINLLLIFIYNLEYLKDQSRKIIFLVHVNNIFFFFFSNNWFVNL